MPRSVPPADNSLEEIRRAEDESIWAYKNATVPELQVYIRELRAELRAIDKRTGYVAKDPPFDEMTASHERLRSHVGNLYEAMAAAYILLSGKERHTSDCRTSRAPAFKPAPCNCHAPPDSEP